MGRHYARITDAAQQRLTSRRRACVDVSEG
jgi:hypothetical protein